MTDTLDNFTNPPVTVWYPGPYNNKRAYSAGALVVTGGHLFVAIGNVPKQTGDGTNPAPADDVDTWDLLL